MFTINDSHMIWFFRYGVQKRNIFVIFNRFLPFYPHPPGDIIILHKCTKNYDQMMYDSWDMVHERCNCYFSFWAIFCTFTCLKPKKIKIFEKMRKRPGNIIILQMCTKNYDQMMYGSWDMVHDRCNYFSFRVTFCPFTPLLSSSK